MRKPVSLLAVILLPLLLMGQGGTAGCTAQQAEQTFLANQAAFLALARAIERGAGVDETEARRLADIGCAYEPALSLGLRVYGTPNALRAATAAERGCASLRAGGDVLGAIVAVYAGFRTMPRAELRTIVRDMARQNGAR